MEYNNKSLSIDEINIIGEIEELSKSLEAIEKSIKEIEETKDIIIENNSNAKFNVFSGVTSNSMNELSLILNYFNNTTNLYSLINKLPDTKKQKKLKDVLYFLSANNKKYNNSPPIKIIVDKIKSKMSNEINDIYTIISTGVDVLMTMLYEVKLGIDSQVISLIIAIITHMLVELKIISTCEIEETHIDEMLDLYFYNRIILPTNSKCCLFSCFGNK